MTVQQNRSTACRLVTRGSLPRSDSMSHHYSKVTAVVTVTAKNRFAHAANTNPKRPRSNLAFGSRNLFVAQDCSIAARTFRGSEFARCTRPNPAASCGDAFPRQREAPLASRRRRQSPGRRRKRRRRQLVLPSRPIPARSRRGRVIRSSTKNRLASDAYPRIPLASICRRWPST